MFAEIKTESKRYIACPNCKSEEEKHYIDHLIVSAKTSETPVTFGRWNCLACQFHFAGRVFNDGSVEITECKLNPNPFVPSLVLLKMDPSDAPVYALLSTNSSKDDLDDERVSPGNSSLAYFYNEHTCPTNWTRDIIKLIVQEDDDPHGLFELVAAMPISDLDEEAKRRFGFDTYAELQYGDKVEINRYAFAMMRDKERPAEEVDAE